MPAACAGISVSELYSMTHGELRLYLKGHSDRLFNETSNAIVGGYYSAYFSWSKNPQSLNDILSGIKKSSAFDEKAAAKTVDFETAKKIDTQLAAGKMKMRGGNQQHGERSG